jgi:hypothetical protein
VAAFAEAQAQPANPTEAENRLNGCRIIAQIINDKNPDQHCEATIATARKYPDMLSCATATMATRMLVLNESVSRRPPGLTMVAATGCSMMMYGHSEEEAERIATKLCYENRRDPVSASECRAWQASKKSR